MSSFRRNQTNRSVIIQFVTYFELWRNIDIRSLIFMMHCLTWSPTCSKSTISFFHDTVDQPVHIEHPYSHFKEFKLIFTTFFNISRSTTLWKSISTGFGGVICHTLRFWASGQGLLICQRNSSHVPLILHPDLLLSKLNSIWIYTDSNLGPACNVIPLPDAVSSHQLVF